jgi:hypothetical protein
MACFEDVVKLLDLCEEQDGTINQDFIESVIIHLESAVEFVEHVLPFVNQCRDDIYQVGSHLRIIYHVWCQKLQEIGQRSNTACTHLAVFSVSAPLCLPTDGPGRPKYKIEEEVLLNLRTLGFKWKEIAQLLLVSPWTV